MIACDFVLVLSHIVGTALAILYGFLRQNSWYLCVRKHVISNLITRSHGNKYRRPS